MALKMILVKTSLNSDGFPRMKGTFSNRVREFDLDPSALGLVFPPGLRHHHHSPNQLLDRDRRKFLVPPDTREFLDPANRLCPILRRTLDGLQPFANLFRTEMIELIGEELDIAQDHRQDIIKIMGHPAGHLSQGFQLLGLDDLILRLFELDEGLLQFGKELGILNGDAHLTGKRSENLEIILIKPSEVMALHIQDTDHLLPHLERKSRF